MQIQYRPNIIGYSIVGKPGYSRFFCLTTKIGFYNKYFLDSHIDIWPQSEADQIVAELLLFGCPQSNISTATANISIKNLTA